MATVAKPTAPTRQIGAPPMVPRIAPREDLNPFRIAQIQFDMAAESARCEIGRGTRLNSSHGYISYAVFCLKKKTRTHETEPVVLKNTKQTNRHETITPNLRRVELRRTLQEARNTTVSETQQDAESRSLSA